MQPRCKLGDCRSVACRDNADISVFYDALKPSKVGQGDLVFGLQVLFTSMSLCARFQVSVSTMSSYDLWQHLMSLTDRPTNLQTDLQTDPQTDGFCIDGWADQGAIWYLDSRNQGTIIKWGLIPLEKGLFWGWSRAMRLVFIIITSILKHTITLQPLYRSAYVSHHLQLRTGEFVNSS